MLLLELVTISTVQGKLSNRFLDHYCEDLIVFGNMSVSEAQILNGAFNISDFSFRY